MKKLFLLFGLVMLLSACGGNVKTSNTTDCDSVVIKEVVDTIVSDTLNTVTNIQ